MNECFLEVFDSDDFFKSFAVSFGRMILRKPELLLKIYEDTGINGYKELFEELKSKTDLSDILRNVNKQVEKYDWSVIEQTYSTWGKYGWVAEPFIVPVGFWGYCPNSQVEADKLVMQALDKKEFLKLKTKLFEIANNKIFAEAMLCFDSKCYSACASLLISLIDGKLIRNGYLPNENKKTGMKAGKRVVKEISKDDMYGLSGFFHLELLNYDSFITTLFQNASGFEKEPNHINRNYLQHGMSKRKVLRRDCVKLIIAYYQTFHLLRELCD